MNTFLIAALVISGAIELLAGVGALSGSFGATVPGLAKLLGTEQITGSGQLLLFLLGLGSIALAALHYVAIRWLRSEKPDGYPLAIALGGAAAVFGLGAFVHTLAVPSGPAGGANGLAFLIVDTLRGLIVGIAAVASMNAPAVIRDLRIPARRDAERPGARRSLASDSRRGPRRDRDGERRRGRGDRERGDRERGRRGGRDSDRAGAPRGRREGAEGSGRSGRGELRERRERRGPVPAPAVEAADSKDLSVVVSGRPPVKAGPPAVPDRSQPRGEPGRDSEERLQIPRAPMVPRVRAEIPPMRPLPDDGDVRDGDRHREDGTERSSRRRRRRSSSRSSRGEERARPLPERAEPSHDDGEEAIGPARIRSDSIRPDSRPEPRMEPRRESVAEPRSESRPEPRPEPRYEPSRDEYAAMESRTSGPDPETHLTQPPIDRISAFGREGESGAEPRTASTPEFGRTRRPFSQHRKGRQVKPRENRVHRTLGGDLEREAGEPKAQETRRVAPEGRIGMTDGIGPIDLEDRERSSDD